MGPGQKACRDGADEEDPHGTARQSLPKSLLVYSASPSAATHLPHLPATSPPPAPALVLDTNTVLDWLVFRDPSAALFSQAVCSGAVRWLACPRMREELTRTLGYRSLVKWKPDSEHVLSHFDAHALVLPEPPPAPSSLRCSDADDQVFLDLALAHGASWLLSHDRALLRLARRTRALGLHIVKPGDWQPPAGAVGASPTPE